MKQTTQTTFNFPITRKRIIVETDLMREMESRVLAIHELCGFCVWYGSSGAGKTTSAEWMTRRINTSFNENDENSFKAVNYEVGKIRAGWGNEAKRAIRTLHSAIAGINLDEGLYGRRPVEELADMVVYAAQKNNIQMVFVDESGLLSPNAIDGLVLVSDKARLLGFNITIVLIGMDDLPQKLEPQKRPQIFRRIHDWCLFRHYDIDQTAELLIALHPHFAALDLTNHSDYEQIKFVHEISNGLPGFIVQFISRFDAQYRVSSANVDTMFLRAVHLRTIYDMRDILIQSKRNGRSENSFIENAESKNNSDAAGKQQSSKKEAKVK